MLRWSGCLSVCFYPFALLPILPSSVPYQSFLLPLPSPIPPSFPMPLPFQSNHSTNFTSNHQPTSSATSSSSLWPSSP